MRVIKFRAWDTKANNWIEGTHLIIHMSGNLLDVPEHIILMQFTGMVDKNGKDIYEGDVLNLEGAAIGWVEYDAEAGAYRVQSHTFWHHLFQIADRKVIGNVYEDPELTR